MKKIKYSTLFVLLSLLCLNNVSASCTNQEKEYFKNIEDEYKITYEFDSNTKKYNVTFYKPQPDKYDYIIYASGNLKCSKIDDNTSKCTNFSSGKYKIEIIGKTKTCNDALKEITLKLAKYNKYSKDSLCKGIEEFVLCQETYDKELDYETFRSRVETYKKTKEKEVEENKKEENNKKEEPNKVITNNISKFIEENLFNIIIISIFIILLIITIVITIKQQRKSRRLE